ncbi:MAG TPA: multicopper oxidase domain-containing protein, partial [Verrucomicrobiota bacterium]|nr:multicopper oxidase domain-containing protein [Verrucomicrobiota bacterium]
MKTSRRMFIHQTASATVLVGAGLMPTRRVLASHVIPVSGYPLTLPPEFLGGTLEAKPVTKEIWPGFPASVLALNGSVPGPTIRVKKGEIFKARLQNSLTEPLVMHWHGILAPSKMDGNPRDAVAAGGAYEVEFPINQRAGTYWYHAHTDQLTGKQVYQGLAGYFIVEDPAEDALGLPRGEFDVPLLLQDRLGSPDHTLAYSPSTNDRVLGFLGDATTINGVPNASLAVTRSLYRFRRGAGSRRDRRCAGAESDPSRTGRSAAHARLAPARHRALHALRHSAGEEQAAGVSHRGLPCRLLRDCGSSVPESDRRSGHHIRLRMVLPRVGRG